MEYSLFSNIVYVTLLISLLIVCCYLLYSKKKGGSGTFISEEGCVVSAAELKEALRKQELALRSINFGLVYIDKDFRVQWETTNQIQQLVTNHKYIPGHFCYLTTGLEKEACVDCPFKAAVKANGIAMRMIYVDDMYFEITATPVYDHPGELIGGLLRIEDVTEKMRLNKSLREAKEKAEEANRLKTAFLANISHEIRTPLNSILGFSDMICKMEDRETKREYYKIIQNNSGMLLHLIDNVLDLSKIEAGRMEIVYAPTNIHELMSDMLIQVQAKNLVSKVKVELVEKSSDYVINTDKVKLTQVIINLINNAIKFTPEGSISVGYRMEGNDSRELYVYVRDTGVGVPADKQETIFDRFVKLDSFVPGAGIGLTICKNTISSMGGTIGVESEVGNGSCFWFRVPVTLRSN